MTETEHDAVQGIRDATARAVELIPEDSTLRPDLLTDLKVLLAV